MELNNNSVQQLVKGLNTDYSPINQPKGTYKYALNAVLESNEGDIFQLSNEEANVFVASLKDDYKIIGTVYIGDDETVIFSTNNIHSEIGIFNSKNNFYTEWCNDTDSPLKYKLNFNTEYPIQAVYRLRRGCEKVVYWVDNKNLNREVNLNYPQNYKSRNGNTTFFDNSKFSIQKKFNKIPIVENIEILEGQGNLPNGSLTILLQYIDNEKNGTKWVSEIPLINIYTDSTKNKYSDIDGSINVKEESSFDNSFSNKAIKIKYKSFDTQYKFYRLAFIHYYSNTKQPTVCRISNVLHIVNGSGEFIYSGDNYQETLSIEDIRTFNQYNNIKTSKTIEQKDNRLILGNNRDENISWENLQKYASKIVTNCVVKREKLEDVFSDNNSKNPFVRLKGCSFMPGEVVSLGIVYQFEDLTESPVMNIVGKPQNIDSNFVYGNSDKNNTYDNYGNPIVSYYGMKSVTNINPNLVYIQREDCNNLDYWGKDFHNNVLKDTPVRFHRLPAREDLNIDLVSRPSDKDGFRYQVNISYPNLNSGTYLFSIQDNTSKENFISSNYSVLDDNYRFIIRKFLTENLLNNNEKLNIKYKKVVGIISETFTPKNNNNKKDFKYYSVVHNYNNLEEKTVTSKIFESDEGNFEYSGVYLEFDKNRYEYEHEPRHIYYGSSGSISTWYFIVDKDWTEIEDSYITLVSDNNITKKYKYHFTGLSGESDLFIEKSIYKLPQSTDTNLYSYNFGIEILNVELPPENVIGKKCIGYYIVKQEIKDVDRTVLDSGFLFDVTQYKEYKSLSTVLTTYGSKLREWDYEYVPGDNKYIRINERDYDRANMNDKFRPTKISDDTKMLLYPTYMFLNKSIESFTHIKGAYIYKPVNESLSGFLVHNVNDSKSNSIDNEDWKSRQDDGASLRAIIRDVEVKPISQNIGLINTERDNIDIYKLNPYYKANDYNNDTIYNMDSMSSYIFLSFKDKNGLGSIEKNKSKVTDFKDNSLQFVYIIKEHNNFYNDFLYAKYYKVTPLESEIGCTTFNGDNYISAYRHTMSSYCNSIARTPIKGKDESSIWKMIGAIILGVVITIASWGTLAMVGGLLIAAAGIVYGVRAKVEQEAFNTAFNVDWGKGLSNTFGDDHFIEYFIKPSRLANKSEDSVRYQDDTMRYYNQVIGDLYFESPINFSLRVEPNNDKNNYLRPFSPHMEDRKHDKLKFEDGIVDIIEERDYNMNQRAFYTINRYFGIYNNSTTTLATNGIPYLQDTGLGVAIESVEEKYFLNKLLERDISRFITYNYGSENINLQVGYKAYSSAKPIFYCTNNDYNINEKLEFYTPIPFEYSLCSPCRESFPQRIHWSDVSNTEELIDKYRIFRPNNYKDLTGEYGAVSNIFSFKNQLYIHTEEGLYIQPTNYQERVTNDIVTYIGTGEFGSLPAQLIVDSKTGNSAGISRRDDQVLTKNGYFFVCQKEAKVYWFNNQLICISDLGMSKWFRDNINKSKYYLIYDNDKDRLIITNKDSWTLSFSLKTNSWISYHSYLPNNYFSVHNKLYSSVDNKIYKHNKIGEYQKFYGNIYPYIVEYVSNENPLITKIFDHIKILTTAYKYNSDLNSYVEERFKTFNKAIIYNTRQCTNILNLKVKDLSDEQEYLLEQIQDLNNNTFIIDRNEKDWSLNDIRDMVTDYSLPMFNEQNYDKIINEKAFEGEKDWYDLESLRDKYLVVRLIFDNFADVKLVLNFTSDYETISQY